MSDSREDLMDLGTDIRADGPNSPNLPVKLTPVTGRISRSKPGIPVHTCYDCDPVKTFVEVVHLRRHQLSHAKGETSLPEVNPFTPEYLNTRPFVRIDGPRADLVSGYETPLPEIRPPTPENLHAQPLAPTVGPREDLVSVHDSGYGSNEASLPIHPEPSLLGFEIDAFKHNGDEDKNEDGIDEIQSLASIEDDIQSQASSYITQEEMLAIEQLTELLLFQEALRPLYEIARVEISRDRLVGNLRRLLKQFYLDLSQIAVSNLEKAATQLLRSRWNRTMISRRITDYLYPQVEDDVDARTLDKTTIDPTNKRARLEAWLANNAGFQTLDNDRNGENDNEDASSDISYDEHSSDPPTLYPKIAEIERFLVEGESFQNLTANLRAFVRSMSATVLGEILMAIPRDKVWFSDKNDDSISNKVKIMIEDLTEDNWHWWPLRPKLRMLRRDETRVHWICNCGSHLWTEIPRTEAETYKKLLAQNLRTSPGERKGCRRRQRKPLGETLIAWISQIAGSTAITDVQGISPQPTFLTSSTAVQSTSTPPSYVQNSLSNSRAVLGAQTIGAGFLYSMGIPSDLYIFFCVKGARRTLEVAQIEVDQQIDDRAFFNKIRIEYRRKRGFLRYWLSPWQLKDCELIKFAKVWSDRVEYRKEDLPIDPLYEYTPRPPMAELPHIHPYEWEMALLHSCKKFCWLAAFHDCIEPRHGTTILTRIPKRKAPLRLNLNDPEEAWGLNAHHTLHFLRVLFYHFLYLIGTFVFWIWWMRRYPGDLQNASVPFTAAAASIAIFWSSVATVKLL